MRTFTVRSLIAVTIAVFGISLAPAQTPTTASMVAEGAQVRQLANGFVFTEGPAVAPNGDVYFSDNRDNKVYRWDVREEKL